MTLAQAQVRSPSDPGYQPTAPPPLTQQAALALLEGAGYVIDTDVTPVPTPVPLPSPGTAATAAPPRTAPTRGRISRDGQQLGLVIGVAVNDPAAVAVASTAADQLRNVGIAATVSALDPVVLYGDALANNRVDAIVGWHRAGGDLATALASRYGCPALEATPVSTLGSPAKPPPTTAQVPAPAPMPAPTTPAATTPATSAPPAPPSEAGALVQAPSNITGVCDRSVQPNIDAALDGSKNVDDVINAVEPRLWSMATVLPILQDNTIVAAGPSVQNVDLTGPIPVGIVGNAGTWVKTP